MQEPAALPFLEFDIFPDVSKLMEEERPTFSHVYPNLDFLPPILTASMPFSCGFIFPAGVDYFYDGDRGVRGCYLRFVNPLLIWQGAGRTRDNGLRRCCRG